MTRTTSRTVNFVHPFELRGVDGVHSPGSYEVEIDEDLLPGVSFPVFLRTETRITLPWRTMGSQGAQTVPIALEELEAALARDAATEPN